MIEPQFEVLTAIDHNVPLQGFVKAWKRGVHFEDAGLNQLFNVASMPFVKPYVAAMPDMHWGNGATVGSVIPSEDAIMPAAVGVDIGCGMMAVRTNMTLQTLQNRSTAEIFDLISKTVPSGRTNNGGPGDRGAWHNVPDEVESIWIDEFMSEPSFTIFSGHHPQALSKNAEKHLGTLGTGNHFIELSYDECDQLWVVLHSGSRGFGNRIGTYFTNLAKERCKAWHVKLPDPELAYFPRCSEDFHYYVKLLFLAQKYAQFNRAIMMGRVLNALNVEAVETIQCHHNYMSEEKHFGKNVILTRKGAVDASLGKKVIIPGSMGARTYIAEGLGSVHSFHSCSHGAGRAMSRTEARKTITLEQHEADTKGVYCHKGSEVIDESPAAYKDIDAVMQAQQDLVKPIHILKQIVCVKGLS